MPRAVIALPFLVACSGKKEAEPPPPVPPVLADASIDGITTIGEFDPTSGAHLDDDGPDRPAPTRRAKTGPAIGIMLKSEPTGATVYIDGVELGTTPRYWTGIADGNEHEFAFTLPRYALARYKFVPIANGTLHATLTRVGGSDTPDAGIVPIAPRPDAAVAPPPTVLPPPVDAAAPPRPDAAPAPRPDAAAAPPKDAPVESAPPADPDP